MITLLPQTTITTAVTGSLGPTIEVPPDIISLDLMAVFNYGTGTTVTAKFWVQTSMDGGTTWTDIANFAFAAADLKKVASVNALLAHTHATVSDAALADNTVKDGAIGDKLRVKYTTTNTYGGNTTIDITAVAKTFNPVKGLRPAQL